MKKFLDIKLAVALSATLMAGASFAGPYSGIHPLQSDRFLLAIGGFAAETNGNYSIGDGPGIDTDDTGLDDSQTIPALAGVWRLTNKSRLQGEYFRINNEGTRTLSESINFPPLDLDFEVGARLESELTIQVARVFYGYSFIKDERMELGGGLGLHYMSLDASLSGSATVDGVPVLDAKVSDDVSAILPNVGGYMNYALSPRWLIGARADWISANIGDFDGELWNVEASVQFQVLEHVGIGASYRYLSVDLAVDDGDNSWAMDLAYEGPSLFITASF